MRRYPSILTGLLFSILIGGFACNENRPIYNSPGPVVTRTEYKAQFKMNAADFDLETTTSMLRSKQVSNADELQARINDPQSGINNVDLDSDGMIDFVAIKEEQQGDNKQLNFVAFPSSKGGQDPVVIASISFQVQNNQLVVAAGYPSYVNGYAGANYGYSMPHTGPSFGEMLFLSWMFAPRPIYMHPVYSSFGYRPRSVIAPTAITTQRTTFRTQTSVAPIQRQAPPAGVGPKFATQADSRFKPAPSVGNSLSSNGRQAQDFKVRDQNVPKPVATGFGAQPKPSTPSPTPTPAVFKPSTPSPSPASNSGWSRPSTPSPTPVSNSSWSRPSTPSPSPASNSGWSRPTTPASNWSRPSGSSFSGGASRSFGGKR